MALTINPSLLFPLLFSQHSFIPFAFLAPPLLHRFTLTQKQQARSLWTGGKARSSRKKKRGKRRRERKNYCAPSLSLSLSVVIEFLNIFSKIA